MVNPTDLMEKGLEGQMAGILAVGLVVSLTAGLAVTGDSPMKQSSQVDSTDWKGVYTVQIERDTDGDGEREVVYEERKENTLTNNGKNWIRSQISELDDKSSNGTDDQEAVYISVGNASDIVQSDNVVDAEIQCCQLSRTQGDSTTAFGDGEFQVQKQFTASISGSGSVIVNTTGLNYNSTGPSLVSGGSFSNANLLDGDQLTVTHNITISDNS